MFGHQSLSNTRTRTLNHNALFDQSCGIPILRRSNAKESHLNLSNIKLFNLELQQVWEIFYSLKYK